MTILRRSFSHLNVLLVSFDQSLACLKMRRQDALYPYCVIAVNDVPSAPKAGLCKASC